MPKLHRDENPKDGFWFFPVYFFFRSERLVDKFRLFSRYYAELKKRLLGSYSFNFIPKAQNSKSISVEFTFDLN
jgi:hypothetical protein